MLYKAQEPTLQDWNQWKIKPKWNPYQASLLATVSSLPKTKQQPSSTGVNPVRNLVFWPLLRIRKDEIGDKKVSSSKMVTLLSTVTTAMRSNKGKTGGLQTMVCWQCLFQRLHDLLQSHRKWKLKLKGKAMCDVTHSSQPFHTAAYRAARVAISAVNGNFLRQQKEQWKITDARSARLHAVSSGVLKPAYQRNILLLFSHLHLLLAQLRASSFLMWW